MFDLNNPAKNIIELLKFLVNDNQEDYFFRGQNQYYDNLVPSFFRELIDRVDNPNIYLNSDKFFELIKKDELYSLKSRFLNSHIHHFGKGIGNILAQQYGLQSEAIDITTNPVIAAFFATRKYPQYSHIENSINSGIIYRFPKKLKLKTIEALGIQCDLAGFRNEEGNLLLFKKIIKRTDLKTDAELNWAQKTRYNGSTFEVISKFTTFVEYKDYKDILKGFFENSEFDYSNSRVARQEGGFILPSVAHLCEIPKNIKADYYAPLRGYFTYLIPISEKLISILNMNAHPDIEVFYFKHTENEITNFTKEYLFPDESEDELFWWQIKMALTHGIDYLTKYDLKVLDMNKGIFNRGYYE